MVMFKSRILSVQVIILIVGFALVSSFFAQHANAANKEPSATAGGSGKRIVKWVDSQGVTHYGDKLPSQEAGRNNTEMNNQGMVVKHNVKSDTSVEQQDQEKLAQQRKDSILLASYTKEDEIDLARDRNLQLDQAALQALTVQKENITARTVRNQKLVDGFITGKKPVPAYLTDELKLAKTETSQIDKQITGRKLNMEATRKRFAEEKMRFVALKQAGSPDASTVSAAPADAAAPVNTPKTTLQPSKTISLPATSAKTK